MPGLLPPHGGLDQPINCTVGPDEIDSLLAEARELTKVPVSDADLSTVYRFGDGGLSPLTGPMGEAAFNRVLDESVIEHNGKKYAWTIPLSLPVTQALADRLTTGQSVALVDGQNEVVGILEISDIFAWDKPRYLKAVYGTERTDHPGADIALKNDADKDVLLGGTIRTLPQPKNPSFGAYVLTTREVRRLLDDKGWDRCVAFQTRNPLHRAHEYALLYGLETLLRQGHNAGACLNPLVGETKADDVTAAIRMKTYEALIDTQGLGEGDADQELWAKVGGSVADRVILLGLDIKMFYAGPKEAVMHGIYRQNYGFSDIVIGRKHADAPYFDGTAIWGDFDAQEIFNNLGGELLIQPLNVGFAAYYESIGRVDLTEKHKDEKPVSISGKEVRRQLQAGEEVDPRIMRPSTAEILRHAMSHATA